MPKWQVFMVGKIPAKICILGSLSSQIKPLEQILFAMKMEKSAQLALFLVNLIIILLLIERSEGDPRNQIVRVICDHRPTTNQTEFVQNAVKAWEEIGSQLRSSLTGKASTGTGPNRAIGLGQCYGDLSIDDCKLCFVEAHNFPPSCFPDNGVRIYLDGCFMRSQNYSFNEQYTGPNDTIVCGNATRKSSAFQNSARQAILNAVIDATRSSRYFARGEMPVSRTTKESAYVSADCWTTLNASSCRACLENASASILQCLPWSEGRALNTGCFMRYSDTNFLNTMAGRSNRGPIIAIVVSVVSSLVVLTAGMFIVLHTRKHREIQKKRKGSYDARNVVTIVNDSWLNFKYSTIEKATGSWDDSKKIGRRICDCLQGSVLVHQSHCLLQVLLVYQIWSMRYYVAGRTSRWQRDCCQEAFYQQQIQSS